MRLSAASSGSLPFWPSQSQGTDPEIAQGTHLGGLDTRPHRSRRPLMNHARSTPRATSASPPRLLPRPPGQERSPTGDPWGGGGGGLAAYLAPRRTWGTRLHPKVGICCWLPAKLCPREFIAIRGQRAGRGLVACASHLLGGHIPSTSETHYIRG